MLVRFIANTVVIDDSDEDFILVGFADEQDGIHRDALHFQRSHKYDEQDIALGMNSVYAERNDQSQGGYGGVERVELHPNRVKVTMGGEVAKRMGASEFEIAIPIPPQEFQPICSGLRKVFAGFGILVEHLD